MIVRIGGARVCRTDIHILEGQWAGKSGVELPYTIGHENAGSVHPVGSAVTNVSEGDKVIVHPLITCGLCRTCRAGDDVHCENNFIGNLVGSYNDLCELMVLAARGRMRLHTAKYSLDRFQDAVDDLDSGRVRGRAILVP
ncbi:alcohol dehydrogenase catalytic domain-containing protein [Streptomyces sp. NPDC127039]|uniref:alcohol dehydrogenase catalytic domain-containing protein n=1 Tax=Streptomyces sp. NPDC127039 TaxID=3347115 RepID=UPI00364F38AC